MNSTFHFMCETSKNTSLAVTPRTQYLNVPRIGLDTVLSGRLHPHLDGWHEFAVMQKSRQQFLGKRHNFCS